jgi:hypothetical protein
LGQPVAEAEVAMQGGPQEAPVLHEKRLIEPKLLHQGDTLGLGMILAQQDGDWIANIGEQGEGDEAHDQKDGNGLQQASTNETEHTGAK